MGIRGLLPRLKSITTRRHISEYANKRIGIDAFGWLHKGAYGCCVQLAQELPTDLYVTYVMERLMLLTSYGIQPLLVFDGAPLPANAATNDKRKQ